MKKFLVLGALAVAIAAVSQQQASAWTSIRSGFGWNFSYSSGGNTALWGAFRNGQPPAPEGCGPVGYPGTGIHPGAGYHPQMQYRGQAPQQPYFYGHDYQHGPAAVPTPAVAPTGNTQAVYRPLPTYNGAFYYPAQMYRH